MKLAYFGDHGRQDEERLKQEFSDIEVEVFPDPLLAGAGTTSDAQVLSVFVDSEFTKDVLAGFPNLKMIAARSAGVDHIDVKACADKGIVIANVPRYGEVTVAEHAFALILSLSRKLFQSYERTEKMNFNRDGLQGFDLFGKTLGVVGCGNIGRNVIGIAKGFHMNVVALDANPDAEFAKEADFEFKDSLEEVLAVSDIITLHVPYLPSTHHMINQDSLSKAKPGAILINTARGGLVETAALLWALDEGILSGAGLDVLEGEHDTYDRIRFMSKNPNNATELQTLVRNHMLVSRDDVIITPHNAYNSQEAVEKIFQTTIDNIKAFLSGNPVNVVNNV